MSANVKIFAETIEQEAYDQIKTLSNFEPYKNSKIRIMPDVHAGVGCTVGTTMTISDKITPNLVGVDIGCGMLTIHLKSHTIDLNRLDDIINNHIPSGFNVHDEFKHSFIFDNLICSDHVDLARANLSIGSLGGGNHFIEVGKSNKTGDLYLIIHSGSRKLGGEVCKYYQRIAQKTNGMPTKLRRNLISKLKNQGRERDIEKELKKIKPSVVNRELAYLSGQDFINYMNDMLIVQAFASMNRAVMADIITDKANLDVVDSFETVHNYIDFNNMILRKGAVSAEKGQKVLIPMNMRDGSLICIGRGNKDWNYSAPHGAGRLMSRGKAKQTIDFDEFKKSMDGIYTSCVGMSTLDEAPQVYKPMSEISRQIKETVKIVDILKPIYNFKAH